MHPVHPRIVSVLIATAIATSLLTAPPADAAILWNNGGLITNPGAGFNGADVSQVSTDVPGTGTAAQNSGGTFRKVADDFVVPAGGWSITSITGYVFMQATYPAAPTSPITSARVDLYNNLPGNGAVNQAIIATTTTILDNSWTGIYLTQNGAANLMQSNRPIMALTVDFGGLNLAAGTYGISFNFNGLAPGNVTGTVVPFVRSVDGSGNPTTPFGNAEVGTSTTGADGTYGWVTQQAARGGVSFPFLINGSVPAPGTAALLGLGGLVAARRRRS